MTVLGKALSLLQKQFGAPPSGLDYSRGWWPLIREPYAGAWQQNERASIDTALANTTVYRCIALIANDVAKLKLRVVKEDSDGIWQENDVSAFNPVLRKPNDYQNRIQFIEHWLISKLSMGNAYILLERDNRNVVSQMFVLDPWRTRPLVAPDGSVMYELRKDFLSGLYDETVTVPASEIIHDRMNAFFHPLCGISPLFAAGLPAMQGLRIQKFSDKFFGNAARPSGVLTAPGQINQATADRLKSHWEQNYAGDNAGRVAVLGDGLTFVGMTQHAADAQLIEQLKLSAENICTAFGVPGYKVGTMPPPPRANVEAMDRQYYDDCLQIHIEAIELLLDEGLGLVDAGYGSEFDLEGLMRMDSAALVKAVVDSVGAGIMTPNEARNKLNLGPTLGGNSPMMQQQNYSLTALAKRDAQNDPFGTSTPAQPPDLTTLPDANAQHDAVLAFRKEFANV
jgi:HK97 family phage portal protein